MRRVKLGEICEINIGKTPSRSEKSFWNGEFCWLSISDMKSKFLSQTKEKITDKAINSTNMKIVRKGTVVMSFKLSIGKVAILSEDMYTNEAIANFVIKNNYDILTDYLYYALQSLKFDHLGDRAVMGKTLNKAKLNNLSIVFYEPNEQRKIVDKLDVISNLIDYRQKQFKELSNLVKSRFYEMFGDIQQQEKYKGIVLKELCNTMSGGTPSTKILDYYRGDIPWITTVSLGENYIDGTNSKGFITQEAIHNSSTKLIPAKNILFGTRVGVGKSSINTVDICINQDIVAIIDIDKSKFNLLFIKYVLDSYKPYYDSIKKGATILGITTEDLQSILVPNAPIDIQNQFADFVAEVDKSQLAIKKSLEELETLKKSLMQAYFG